MAKRGRPTDAEIVARNKTGDIKGQDGYIHPVAPIAVSHQDVVVFARACGISWEAACGRLMRESAVDQVETIRHIYDSLKVRGLTDDKIADIIAHPSLLVREPCAPLPWHERGKEFAHLNQKHPKPRELALLTLPITRRDLKAKFERETHERESQAIVAARGATPAVKAPTDPVPPSLPLISPQPEPEPENPPVWDGTLIAKVTAPPRPPLPLHRQPVPLTTPSAQRPPSLFAARAFTPFQSPDQPSKSAAPKKPLLPRPELPYKLTESMNGPMRRVIIKRKPSWIPPPTAPPPAPVVERARASIANVSRAEPVPADVRQTTLFEIAGIKAPRDPLPVVIEEPRDDIVVPHIPAPAEIAPESVVEEPPAPPTNPLGRTYRWRPKRPLEEPFTGY